MSDSEAIVGRDTGRRNWVKAAAGNVAMVVLLAVAVWAGRHAARPGVAAVHGGLSGLPTAVLAARAPTIVLVFQLMDCASDRDRLASWNRVAETERVNVVAVLVGSDFTDEEVVAVIGDRRNIPVLRDRGRHFTDLTRSMGYVATPIMLAFDTAGRVRASGPLEHARSADGILTTLRTLAKEAE